MFVDVDVKERLVLTLVSLRNTRQYLDDMASLLKVKDRKSDSEWRLMSLREMRKEAALVSQVLGQE